jgi:hypothetical protein
MHIFNQGLVSGPVSKPIPKCKLEAKKTQEDSFTDNSFFRAFGWSITQLVV